MGYVEGRDVTLEIRAADGREERLSALATELVRLPVNVIVTAGGTAIRAARNATSSVLIVFASTGDPVAEGIVTSLAHPGGNATGLTLQAGHESAKRLQLLIEAFPRLTRVATLGTQRQSSDLAQTQAAAATLNVQILPLELRNSDELEVLLSEAFASGADSLVVFSDALFMPLASRMVAFAAAHRLPAMYSTSTYARAGGLLVYGVNIPANLRRAATYVDKILRGARPADLPVERPTTYGFVVNLETARSLGFRIPQSVLAQATEIIQ